MDFNFLEVYFIDDDLPKRTHNKINNKMEQLQEEIRDQFNNWLDEK